MCAVEGQHLIHVASSEPDLVGFDELRDVPGLLEALVGAGKLPLAQEVALGVLLQVTDHLSLGQVLRAQLVFHV